MITENISALKIQKLSQDQFKDALANGSLESTSVYLTPTEVKDYALKSDLSKKADLVDGKIPVEQIPTDAFESVTAWEDLDNKPFYETGWSVNWDGTPTEEFIDVTDTMGAVIYKVGEAKTKEDLIGATCKYILNETEEVTFTIAKDNIVGILDENGNETDKGFIIFDGYKGILAVCREPGTYYYSGLAFTYEVTGLYFVKASNYTPIYVGIGEIKTLDAKFIPSEIGTWENMPDKPFEERGFHIEYDLSEASITAGGSIIDGATYKYYKVADYIENSLKDSYLGLKNDGSEECLLNDERWPLITSAQGSEYNIYVLNIKNANEVVDMEDTFDIPSFTVPEPGLYFINTKAAFKGSFVFYYLRSSDYKLTLIDKKFISPEVCTWKNIPDKPFEVLDNTITWDGIPTAESVEIGELIFYKVSDAYCKAEELLGKDIACYNSTEKESMQFTIESENLFTEYGSEDFFAVTVDGGTPLALITSGAITIPEVGVEIPSAGTWFLSVESVYTSYLEMITIKYLDPRVIPDYYQEIGTKLTWDGQPTNDYIQLGEIIEWDGSDTGVSVSVPSNGGTIPEGVVLYKVAEKLPSLEDWRFTVEYSTGSIDTITLYSEDIGTSFDDNNNVIATYGNLDFPWVWNVEQTKPIPFMDVETTFPEPGLYFVSVEGQLRVTRIFDSMYGNMEGLKLYRISEPLDDDLLNYKMDIFVDGENTTLTISNSGEDYCIPYYSTNTGTSGGFPYIVNALADNEIIDFTDIFDYNLKFTISKAGLYLIDFASTGAQFNYLVSPNYKLKQIDEKYLSISSSSSGINHYGGASVKDNTNDSVDFIVLNYFKAVAYAQMTGSYEDFYSKMGYGVLKDEEFILNLDSFSGGSLSSAFDSLRIGICDSCTAVGNETIFKVGTVIELTGVKLIDLSNTYTIRCYKHPNQPNWYVGTIADGITSEIQDNLNLPVSSKAVYRYIDNLGLDAEELADTKNKANTQADWAENNSSSVSYIRNRLVYDAIFHDTVSATTKPAHTTDTKSFGSVTFSGYSCEYRLLVEETIANPLEFAKQISYINFAGSSYPSRYGYLVVSGSDKFATVKYKRYTSDNYPPLVIIKGNVSNSYSETIDGIEIPGGWSGIYVLCNIDEVATDCFVTKIMFNTIPHQLPVEYIPTDKEVTRGSTNLISSGAVHNALSSIEDNLQFDSAPTLNSEKLVKSGGIATALSEKVDKTSVDSSIETLNTEINKKANQSDINNTINNLNTEINKKANQSDVTASVNNLTTEINKKADSSNVYSKSEIDGFLTGAFHYRGSVNTFAGLPATAEVGDVYNIKTADITNNVKAGDNVVWCEIDGSGHWDILSGIVDLSAYWTSEEVQNKLTEINATKADLAMLSKVAKSNNYQDLTDTPCSYIGLDLIINKVDNYTNAIKYSNTYYYEKVADYDSTKTIQDYIDGFISYTWRSSSLNETVYTAAPSNILENGILAYNNATYPAFLIVPADDLKFGNKTFSSGIYRLIDKNIQSNYPNAYANKITFQKKYTPLDLNYLPSHNHTALEISDLTSILSTKIDKDANARLLTNEEGTKLAGIAENANNYSLPAATASRLGGVKVGANLSVSADGTISATSLDWDNIDNKPTTFTPNAHNHNDVYYTESEIDTKLTNKQDKSNLVTTLSSISTDSQYPSAKLVYNIKTNLETSINSKVDKVTGSRLMTNTEGTKLAGIDEGANKYTLPAATTSSLGGVKVGANLSVSADGTISATSLDWTNIKNKPTTFTPSTHNHDDLYYTESEINDLLSSIRASVDTKASQNALNTTNSNIQKLSDKIGTANGIASLDSTGKLNATQVPTNVQLTANMVTNIDSITSENQYPSAGLLKRTKESLTSSISSINTKLQNVEGIINEKQTKNLVTRIDENSTDEQYPSAKLLYSICSGYDELVESILTIIGDNTTV